MEACILSHRKGVGTMICIGIAEKFLNQIVAGDEGETSAACAATRTTARTARSTARWDSSRKASARAV
jgi:hypothetical protein